jgi:S1-C subfamily serine protease
MVVEFAFSRGAQAGTTARFERSVITIGRHPTNDLAFDPERDLDASSRHAEVRVEGDQVLLVDIGSTNGTYLNGIKLEGPRALHTGDVVEFGAGGPKATVQIGDATVGRIGSTRDQRAAPAKNTELRIAEAVRAQTGSLRKMIVGLAVVLIVGGSIAVSLTLRAAKASRNQVAQLLAANDSLARSLTARLAQTGVADAALQEARAEMDRLTGELRTRSASGDNVTSLAARIRERQQRTASFARTDYSAILAANKPAVVFIAVEMPDGTTSSGTGFNILPTGLVVTNRHVVQSRDGVRARRVAVAFEGTRGEWRMAEIETVSPTDELATLRLTAPGPYPVVNGIARDSEGVKLGDPVAILGFPLGTATAGNEGSIDNLRPVATLGIGTVSKTLPENIQLDAYAAQGSSGSPVFDARGLVVGVLFGAAAESNGRIIYTVPSARLSGLLTGDAAAALR